MSEYDSVKPEVNQPLLDCFYFTAMNIDRGRWWAILKEVRWPVRDNLQPDLEGHI